MHERLNNSRYLNNAIRQVGRAETAGLYSFGREEEDEERRGARAALGALFHRLDFNLSSLQFRRRNVLVLREPPGSRSVLHYLCPDGTRSGTASTAGTSRGLHRSR